MTTVLHPRRANGFLAPFVTLRAYGIAAALLALNPALGFRLTAVPALGELGTIGTVAAAIAGPGLSAIAAAAGGPRLRPVVAAAALGFGLGLLILAPVAPAVAASFG
jgi:hypothetical protein